MLSRVISHVGLTSFLYWQKGLRFQTRYEDRSFILFIACDCLYSSLSRLLLWAQLTSTMTSPFLLSDMVRCFTEWLVFETTKYKDHILSKWCTSFKKWVKLLEVVGKVIRCVHMNEKLTLFMSELTCLSAL